MNYSLEVYRFEIINNNYKTESKLMINLIANAINLTH